MNEPTQTSPTPAPDQDGDVAGRVALVTGAGSGIGRAAALAFARQGAAVVLAGRRAAELDGTAALIAAVGGTSFAVPTDVADEAAVERLLAATRDRFGRLDAAFNNAGILAMAPIAEATAAHFDTQVAVNLRGVWLLIKHEAALMRAPGPGGDRGGAIVNTSSFVAQSATAGTSAYAASKGALDAMIRPLAAELGPDGIRINNVAPGVIRTPMSLGGTDGGHLAPFAEKAALNRLGEAEDIADVAVWLCSPGARFVTGQTILADGGLIMTT